MGEDGGGVYIRSVVPRPTSQKVTLIPHSRRAAIRDVATARTSF